VSVGYLCVMEDVVCVCVCVQIPVELSVSVCFHGIVCGRVWRGGGCECVCVCVCVWWVYECVCIYVCGMCVCVFGYSVVCGFVVLFGVGM